MSKQSYRLLLIVVILGAVAAFFFSGFYRYLSFQSLNDHLADFRRHYAEHPILISAGFFALYTVATALPTAVAGSVLTIASGALFGMWLGSLIASFASTLAAILTFLASRFLFRDFVMNRFHGKLAIVDRGMRDMGVLYLVSLRLVPWIPFAAVNLIMGLTSISAVTFTWVTQLALLPLGLVYVYAGTQIAELSSPRDVMKPGVLLAFTFLGTLPILVNWFFQRNRKIKSELTARKHAVVVGAGIGGLVSARILHKHFDQVTVIERDDALDREEMRRGAPQGWHPHVLLKRGKDIICELFPGLEAELENDGSPRAEFPRDIRRLGPYGAWEPQYNSGLTMRLFTRPFLESRIFRRVQGLPNVKFIMGSTVTGLVSSDSETVTGVRIKGKSGELETEILADLVVNTSGRTSQMKEWLSLLNFEVPGETRLPAGEWYVTRHYKLADFPRPWKVIYIPKIIPMRKSRPRGAFIGEIENGCHIVSLVGSPPQRPPRTEADFLEFARGVENGLISPLLEGAESRGKFEYFSNFDNVCLRLDYLKRWPRGLLVLGDALARFNPVYGQGMTTAIVGAETLGKALEQTPKSRCWEQDFHRTLLGILETPWSFSTMESLSHSPLGAKPSRWPHIRIRRYVFDQLTLAIYRAMFHNPAIHEQFIRSQHLLQPISTLYRLPILASTARTLLRALTGRSRVTLANLKEAASPPLTSQE